MLQITGTKLIGKKMLQQRREKCENWPGVVLKPRPELTLRRHKCD